MTPENMTDLLAAFQQFDKNSDGFISKEELSEAMANFGHIISNEELDQIIKAVDIDVREFFSSVLIFFVTLSMKTN